MRTTTEMSRTSRKVQHYHACRQGNVECVELLLEWVADPLATDPAGVSCLEIARRRGHEEVVSLLEQHGLVSSTGAAQALWWLIKRLFHVFSVFA
jgi:ankyrin repeat protein